MLHALLFFFFTTSFLIFPVSPFKILVFSPATSRSHLISNGRIADELTRAGHDVTLLEIDFLDIANTTRSSKLVKKTVIGGLRGSSRFQKVLQELSRDILKEESIFEEMHTHWAYQSAYHDLCEELIHDNDVFFRLKSEHFDGFIAEQINMCGFGYAYALGIERRFLLFSSSFFTVHFDIMGLPAPFSTVPFSSDLSMTPSYTERASNLFCGLAQNILYRYINWQLTKVYRTKFGPKFPTITEIVRDVDFVFVATDEIIDFPFPTLPNLIHIGGIGVDEDVTELSERFQSEMEKGKRGVVLFSFGTIVNTSTFDERIMLSLLDVFQKFPDYHFLIRADKSDVNTRDKANGIRNVFVSDWLPQTSILHHPRLLAFVTHAGYNGIIEAARAGVPLITIPLIFDQNLNSRAVESKGWGVRRHKRQLLAEPEAVESAIREILENPKYAKAARRVRDLIRSKPTGARDRLTRTLEWVIRNGGVKEMRSASRNLNVLVFYNLDIILPLLILPIIILAPFLARSYYFSCFGHIEQKSKVE